MKEMTKKKKSQSFNEIKKFQQFFSSLPSLAESARAIVVGKVVSPSLHHY